MAFENDYNQLNTASIRSAGQSIIGGIDVQKQFAAPSKPQGPIEDVVMTLNAARLMAQRVRQLADKALGSIPEASPSTSGERILPEGSIPRLQLLSSDISTEIGDAMQACTRLERALAS